MEAQATYPAPAARFVNQGQSIGQKLADRPATEMEAFTSNLADTARRLNTMADRLERRIANFLQQPAALPAAETASTPPEPQPGTIGAMKFWHGRVNEETKRIDQALETLAGIL